MTDTCTDDGCDRPEHPALRYKGGKWRLARWIIAHLPAHHCYVEPFCGGASVLLRKPRSKIEVLADKAGVVVTFFRILRDRPQDLVRALQLTPFAGDEYKSADWTEPGLTDVEAARRFFVHSWGGNMSAAATLRNRGWRRDSIRDCAGDFTAAVDGLEVVARRLRSVSIDNLDYNEILKRYDAPSTCFYVDPPYVLSARRQAWRGDGYGDLDWTDDQHVELLERLRGVKGSVVLSGYPSELYSKALGGWRTVAFGPGKNHLERLWVSPGASVQMDFYRNDHR
jgi:DNA adenine methylase